MWKLFAFHSQIIHDESIDVSLFFQHFAHWFATSVSSFAVDTNEYRTVDLTSTKSALVTELNKVVNINRSADININPRLRMTTLYAIGAAENRLVAGTGNRSERYMGYFTKWGDGAYDFDPIADLTVSEVYEFLAYLNAPVNIRTKAPSAGLFEGQTDELEMGVTYKTIDDYINGKEVSQHDKEIIDGYHERSEHKRVLPSVFKDN